MKNLLVLLSLAVLVSCMPSKGVDGEASSGNINSAAPYRWEISAFPRDLRISNNFSAAEVTNFQSMSTAWETGLQNKRDFFTNTNRTPEVDSTTINLDALGDDNINGIYKIQHWPTSLNSGALAVTQLFGRRFNVGSGNEYVRIEHADILVNENIYDFRTDDSTSGWTYDLRTVMLHEMGHYLGLAHKYGDTVMVPSVNTGTVTRAPKNVDVSDMASKYSITLTGGSSSAIVGGNTVNYSPNPGDQGQQVKILIELMASGECVHKENGAIVSRHPASID